MLALVVLILHLAAREGPRAVCRGGHAVAARGRCAGARCVQGSAAMTRLAAIALVVAAMLLVRHIGPGGDSAIRAGRRSRSVSLLALALVAGEFLRRFRMPRLTGYLLFGLLVGPYLGNVITEVMARQLLTVNGIATTLIAFIAGLTLNIERLERRVAGAGLTTVITLGTAMAGLGLLAWIVWPWLPIAPQATGTAKLAMIALMVVIVVSFSPTMSAAVIAETGSRGKLSDFVLATVVLADIIVLVLFSVFMQLARATFGDNAPGDVNMLVRLSWEIGGAVAFGCLVGALFALYLRYVGREVTLALLVVCLLLSQVGMTPARRAAAGRDGGRHRHRECGRRAGRDAEGRDSVGRAAVARRVFRRNRHIVASRYARDRGAGRGRPGCGARRV